MVVATSAGGISVAVMSTVIGLIILGVITLYYVRRCLRRKFAARKERSSKEGIYQYMQRFDVEDIDLRRAPTGGWHGTYCNKLAYGINDADSLSKSSDDGSFLTELLSSDSSSGADDDDDLVDHYINSYDNNNPRGGIIKDNYNNGDIENGRNMAVPENFEKAKSLFIDATESIPYYYGLSKVDDVDTEDSMTMNNKIDYKYIRNDDEEKIEHRPWRITDDTI